MSGTGGGGLLAQAAPETAADNGEKHVQRGPEHLAPEHTAEPPELTSPTPGKLTDSKTSHTADRVVPT